MPPGSPRPRCALTAPFHPYLYVAQGLALGGLFSVALSFKSPRLAVNQHPALWSPTFLDPRPTEGHSAGTDRDHPAGSPSRPSSGTLDGPTSPDGLTVGSAALRHDSATGKIRPAAPPDTSGHGDVGWYLGGLGCEVVRRFGRDRPGQQDLRRST